MKGHCYVASEAFYHLTTKPNVWKPGTLFHENEIHWVLKNKQTGKILDITVKQFKDKPDYSKFRGRGFLTKAPSKRTVKLITKILEKQNEYR